MTTDTDTQTIYVRKMCRDWLTLQWRYHFYYRGLRVISCIPTRHDTYTLYFADETRVTQINQWESVALVGINHD